MHWTFLIEYYIFKTRFISLTKMPFKKILLIKPFKTSGFGFIEDTIPIGLEYIAAYIQNYVEKVDIIDLAKDPKNPKRYQLLYLHGFLCDYRLANREVGHDSLGDRGDHRDPENHLLSFYLLPRPWLFRS